MGWRVAPWTKVRTELRHQMTATHKEGSVQAELQDDHIAVTDDRGQAFSFDAHGGPPQPTLLGWGLSAGGHHWSNRDPNAQLERHTAVQEIVTGTSTVAWYTQEFIPDADGVDYRMAPTARVYAATPGAGKEACVYKGSCYGDLAIDGRTLYLNSGNRIGSVDLDSGAYTELFQHSGLKKNGTDLRITPDRIFFSHWTKDKVHLMWYDRRTGEVVNPHVDSGCYFLLGDTAIVQNGCQAWVLDLETLKKRRFLTKAAERAILEQSCALFGLDPDDYAEDFEVGLLSIDEHRAVLRTSGVSYRRSPAAEPSETVERRRQPRSAFLAGLTGRGKPPKADPVPEPSGPPNRRRPDFFHTLAVCDSDGKHPRLWASSSQIIPSKVGEYECWKTPEVQAFDETGTLA